MKKIILALSILILLSCEDDRLPENTFDIRKATSERELLANGFSTIPGQVVSIQLEYKNQDLSSVSSSFDSGGLGDDVVKLSIKETFESIIDWIIMVKILLLHYLMKLMAQCFN